ncbi:MAG: DNA-formamidopyrimidine glycosylase [Bacilli bacterium]|nr:DNA-formamidopyrimidine glycosylase [Bacilli bacterium]
MPELPEVENVKQQLKKRLLNKTITDIDVLWANIIEAPSVSLFKQNIINQTIIDIKRRGKWLILELNNYYLLIHLRMEGKFSFKEKDELINKHEHIIFTIDNNIHLRYQDTRKFGKMHLIDKDKLYDSKPLKDLGLEPFDDLLTAKYLKSKLKNKTIPIKISLLDQSIISGIGNIYADEILFLSSVNPSKKSSKLSNKELELIILNTKEVLNKAIKLGGTTIRSFVSLDNQKGSFQDELFVHQRVNKPCKKCNTLIKKIYVGGRGTYYCPVCQKLTKTL